MTYEEIHPAIRGFVGAWEGFRKLGFKSDDIFCEVAGNPGCPPGHIMVFATLKSQGKEFRIGIAFWPEADVEGLYEQWRVASVALTRGDVPQADCDRIWQESLPYNDAVGFVMALRNKGFAIPSAMAKRMS